MICNQNHVATNNVGSGCAVRIYTQVSTEGSLEVKIPTIWTDEKQSWAEAERRGE